MTIPSITDCIGMNTFQTYLNNKMDGTPLANGKVYFYSQTNPLVLKDVYALSRTAPYTNLIVLPNPNTINADGTLSDDSGNRAIPYFYPLNANGQTELYQIQIYDSASNLQDTLFDMPPNAATIEPTTSGNFINYVLNPQFLLWDYVPVSYGSGTPPTGGTIVTTAAQADTLEQIVDGWFFQRSASTTVDNFSQQAFVLGETAVESNPRYYLKYTCTSASGETYKRLLPTLSSQNVGFLQGQTVTFSFWGLADQAGRSVRIRWFQSFGTSGSPASTLSSVLYTFSLGTTWQKFVGQFVVPSTSGASSPNDSGDYCYFTMDLDINVSCSYSFDNVLLTDGNVVNPACPELTYVQYKSQMPPWFKIPTGDYKFAALGTIATLQTLGWYSMTDGVTVGNGASAATPLKGLAYYNLFVYLYQTYGNTICPVSTGRGSDAIADWNAGKTITVPITGARLIGNAGAGSGLTTRAAGAIGGHESAVATHTHGFTNGVTPGTGHVATSNLVWTGDNWTDVGAVFGAIHTGAINVTDITATDEPTPVTSDSMNPFTFLQLYIHA